MGEESYKGNSEKYMSKGLENVGWMGGTRC